MKIHLAIIGLVLMCVPAMAQIETSINSTRFEASDLDKTPSKGFDIPAGKSPALTIPREPKEKKYDLGKEEKEEFSMVDDRFIEYQSKLKPRMFTKDKEIKSEYGKDMYLGDVSTKSNSVSIWYRDHEYVDGDRVRVYVNGEMIVANVMLEAEFKGIDFPLVDGFNKIEFEALNQGSSGPNTAQMQIRDETGTVIASYEWNLLTGNKATAIVVKRAL